MNNIFFKFVLDSQNVNGVWIYGGAERNDEKAMKSGLNELKSLSSIFQCKIQDIYFPLISLIHYQGLWSFPSASFPGYLLVAVSLLPIQKKQSLIYGSCDGGTCFILLLTLFLIRRTARVISARDCVKD